MQAGASLGLTGRYHLLAAAVRRGLELWAKESCVELRLENDGGDLDLTEREYRRLLGGAADVLLGPYGSDAVRRAATVVCAAGRLMWNHGGSADDLAQPFLVTLSAPASTYFYGCMELARERDQDRVVIAQGRGLFARLVARGASDRADDLGIEAYVVSLDRLSDIDVSGSAVLVVGTFEDDVAEVMRLRTIGTPIGLIGCVAAGIPAFGQRLGSLADGVLGPVQWFPQETRPEVGPSGVEFARAYRRFGGAAPGYVAAQAAAAGFLAAAAWTAGLDADQVRRWHTTTMLGNFALDDGWRQVGHSCRTIEWRKGVQVLVR